MKIRKRNGSEVTFNKHNIVEAITRANSMIRLEDRLSVCEIKDIAKQIEDKCKQSTVAIQTDDIQNFVEKAIMAAGKYDVATAYIVYRYQKALDTKKNTIDDRVLSLLSGDNEDIQQENANKNPNILSTMRDYMAGEVSKDLSQRYLLPADIYKAHKDGIIHFHDMDYFAMPEHNCCLINLDDMLQNGTVISGNTIDKPHTFKTACNIASQIIAQVASSQYGGQTITVSHLSKFVPETREYFKQKYPTLSAEQIEDLVKDDIEGGVQTLQYQILTLQTTNGQTPFVSVCLYLNEAENEEAKEDLARVIEEILKQRIKGVKNESGQYYANPFPKLLYFLEEDNITPDSKYWYLTKLAATCTTKRMVPDYISEKIMKQQKISKKGEEGDAYPCMGCVSGDSVVRIKDDNETKFITMEELWINYAKNIKHQFTEDNPNLYTLVDNLKIFDNKLGDYTTCKMINKNINNNWVLLKLKSDTEKCEIKCTDNHIWTTIEGIDKTAKELSLNDKLYYSISDKELIEMNIESIIYIQDDKPSYDVTTETEHFEVNGLYSHNCRSFLTPYRQPKHDETLTFTEDVDLEIES
jgi:anaerobic ribonucleoside-triphosphate reductase